MSWYFAAFQGWHGADLASCVGFSDHSPVEQELGTKGILEQRVLKGIRLAQIPAWRGDGRGDLGPDRSPIAGLQVALLAQDCLVGFQKICPIVMHNFLRICLAHESSECPGVQ
ncbi:28S ribosomal protein S33, mitochondrial isoform X2 [Moschus berezovskii]|uniref:28S ribosomal protein S33, mitochondrial isoform X2 n=1 Tax=Moschus berezovskii TaxID=68408 RepID=UPI00244488B6|nr:28S ribosomal protein S33, mitochondrial isoform X2 [Moschus berezovskii]